MTPSVEARIRELQLERHPEGGWFREIFRSTRSVQPAQPGNGRGSRASLSVIHFLLSKGERSRWHGLRSDEQWTYLEGSPLALYVLNLATGWHEQRTLGPTGEGFDATAIVEADTWQAARSTGAYTLVACTVGPGFDFEDFRFLADDAEAKARLAVAWPETVSLV